MMQRALGILGFAVGLVVFSRGGWLGICIIVLALAVFNGARHEVWLSLDFREDGGPGDASDDPDGRAGGGGDGSGGDGD